MELPANPNSRLTSLLYHDGPLNSKHARRVNVVCDAFLDRTIPLAKMQSMYNAKLDKSLFSAMFLRFRHRSLTCIMFGTGKITITGGNSVADCWLTLWYAAERVARAIGKPCKVMDARISNVVVTMQLQCEEGSLVSKCDTSSSGCWLDLEALYKLHSSTAKYNPQDFPGLQLVHHDPDFTAICFHSGKVNIMGQRDLDTTNKALAIMPSLVQKNYVRGKVYKI